MNLIFSRNSISIFSNCCLLLVFAIEDPCHISIASAAVVVAALCYGVLPNLRLRPLHLHLLFSLCLSNICICHYVRRARSSSAIKIQSSNFVFNMLTLTEVNSQCPQFNGIQPAETKRERERSHHYKQICILFLYPLLFHLI